MTSALAFRDIVHDYGPKRALSGVSFEVAPGETVALLGPSGCGKSTLLRVAAGLERQTCGAVEIAGRVVADERRFAPPEKRGVGMVFQDYALFPHLDLAANVAFGLKGEAAPGRVKAMLDLVGLAGRARDYPHQLSGGEQQRVALARALAPGPALLALDEPFSNLDQVLRRAMRAQTQNLLRRAGAASLIVTHDPDDAFAVADRIGLMRAGRLVQIGAPEELFARPVDAFALRFFSDVEEWATQARGGGVDTPFGRREAPGAPDGPALFCARKTALRVAADADGPATVRESRFEGERVAMLVELPYGQRVEALRPPVERLTPGTRARVTIDPGGAFVFPGAAAADGVETSLRATPTLDATPRRR